MSLSSLAKQARDALPQQDAASVITYKTTRINVERDLEGLIAAVESAYPDFTIHEAAMTGAGRAPTGEPMVPFAAAGHDGRSVNRSVTVYYSGKVSWMNCEPVSPVAAEAKAA